MVDSSALDVEVAHVGTAAVHDPPATGTWREATDVGIEASRAEWAEVARPVLIDAARSYRAVVTYKELAAEVQHRTGIRTKQPIHYWISDVLGRVSRDSAARDEPLLSALCVNSKGSVGPGYAEIVGELTGDVPADPDDHAARERLACHRLFEAEGLPENGGTPALVPMLAQARTRERKAAASMRPIATCPICQMALLPTGVCDTCG
jgi:hypothetical protein